MSDLIAPRKRRADAERSIAAILDAATQVLGVQPDASMDDIARAANTSRQTVYAHFPSRDLLVTALLDRTTERVVSALRQADLNDGPAAAALVRFLEVGWQSFDGDPFLLQLAARSPSPEQQLEQHRAIFAPLEDLIERGRRSGDFDADLPTAWILSATVALGHAAGEEVRSGRMTSDQAIDTLRRSIPRLFRGE